MCIRGGKRFKRGGPHRRMRTPILVWFCWFSLRWEKKLSCKRKVCRCEEWDGTKNLRTQTFDNFFCTRRATLTTFFPFLRRLLRTRYACKHFHHFSEILTFFLFSSCTPTAKKQSIYERKSANHIS